MAFLNIISLLNYENDSLFVLIGMIKLRKLSVWNKILKLGGSDRVEIYQIGKISYSLIDENMLHLIITIIIRFV